MAKKKCRHKNKYWARDDGFATSPEAAIKRMCHNCGAELPLGPSNDEPNVVQEEIEACAVEIDPVKVVNRRDRFAAYYHGWRGHMDDQDPPSLVGITWRAGWLGREMSCADIHSTDPTTHDQEAWPWDPTRPVAGQYEEHLASLGDALSKLDAAPVRDEHARADIKKWTAERTDARVAEQTRHDVAASVVRHDGLPATSALPTGWGRDLDAINYEHQRAAEPDCRDEDEPLTGEHPDALVIESDAPEAAETPTDDQLLSEIAHSPPRQPHVSGALAGTPDERFDTGGDS